MCPDAISSEIKESYFSHIQDVNSKLTTKSRQSNPNINRKAIIDIAEPESRNVNSNSETSEYQYFCILEIYLSNKAIPKMLANSNHVQLCNAILLH